MYVATASISDNTAWTGRRNEKYSRARSMCEIWPAVDWICPENRLRTCHFPSEEDPYFPRFHWCNVPSSSTHATNDSLKWLEGWDQLLTMLKHWDQTRRKWDMPRQPSRDTTLVQSKLGQTYYPRFHMSAASRVLRSPTQMIAWSDLIDKTCFWSSVDLIGDSDVIRILQGI